LSLTHVVVTAMSGGVFSLIVLVLYDRWKPGTGIGGQDALIIAVVVALSILLWREAGNTAVLNDDPIPLVSPNDVLCPMVTYVCLSMLAGIRGTLQRPEWPRVCGILTLLSFAVNVATI
jgi:hypothetical protein